MSEAMTMATTMMPTETETTTTARTCPHCGKALPTHGGGVAHVRSCAANPEIRAAVLLALTDPDQPGAAVGVYAYDKRRRTVTSTPVPAASTLIVAYGSWEAVCAAMDLRRDTEGFTLTPGGLHVCVHCRHAFLPASARSHAGHCVERPGMRETLRTVMADPDAPGAAITRNAYKLLCSQPEHAGLPSHTTLASHFGTWEGVIAWLDLALDADAAANALAEANELRAAAEDERLTALYLAQEKQPRGIAVCGVRALANGREVAYMLR